MVHTAVFNRKAKFDARKSNNRAKGLIELLSVPKLGKHI